MKNNARITPGKPVGDGRNKASCKIGIAPNPHFTRSRVGEEFDILHAFPQLVEHGGTAFEQRGAVNCWLGAMTVALKQANAEYMFEVGNDLGYDGLGNGEMLRRFGHALALHY